MKRICFLIVFILILLTSCSTTDKIIEVHDTINIERLNNIYIHDSIFKDRVHYEYIKGDTAYLIDSIISKEYHNVHDTIINDSIITKTEYKDKIVEKNKYPLWPYIVFVSLFAIGVIVYKFKYYKYKCNN